MPNATLTGAVVETIDIEGVHWTARGPHKIVKGQIVIVECDAQEIADIRQLIKECRLKIYERLTGEPWTDVAHG